MGRDGAYKLVARALEKNGYARDEALFCAKTAVDVLVNSGEVVEGEAHRALQTLYRQTSARLNHVTSEVERLRAESSR